MVEHVMIPMWIVKHAWDYLQRFTGYAITTLVFLYACIHSYILYPIPNSNCNNCGRDCMLSEDGIYLAAKNVVTDCR